MNEMKKYVNVTTVTVFVVAFLLGYGTSSQIINRSKQAGGEGTPQETTQMIDTEKPESALADISAASAENDTISADDQPAGSSVAVAVKLEKGAWVAVHEDADGKPGKILGAQLFPAGTHLGKIDLLRATSAAKKYYAMLHSDSGDHTFDATADAPVKNAAGDAIMHAFRTMTGSAAQ